MILRSTNTSPVGFALLVICAGALNACNPNKDAGEAESLSAGELQNLEQSLNSQITEAIQMAQTSELASSTEYNSVLASDYSDAPIASAGATEDDKVTLSLASKGNWFQNIWSDVQAGWEASNKSICKILAPQIKAGGVMATRPYFFLGGNLAGNKGFVGAGGGVDFVWDLYNMQFGSFHYYFAQVVAGPPGVGANTYGGLGFGKRSDVNQAWSGYFRSGGLSVGLPKLPYLSATGSLFIGATKNPKTLKIEDDPSFAGYSVGASFSFPSQFPWPATANVTEGLWTSNETINNFVSERWTKAKLRHTKIKDSSGSTYLSINSTNPNGRATYTNRALNLAHSIPLVIGPKGSEAATVLPGMKDILLLALATGALRDTLNASQACASQK